MTSGDVWKIGTSQLLIHVLCRREDVAEKGHTMAKEEMFRKFERLQEKKVFFYSDFSFVNLSTTHNILRNYRVFFFFAARNSTLNSINQTSFNDVTLGVPFIPHISCHKSNKVSFHHHIVAHRIGLSSYAGKAKAATPHTYERRTCNIFRLYTQHTNCLFDIYIHLSLGYLCYLFTNSSQKN